MSNLATIDQAQPSVLDNNTLARFLRAEEEALGRRYEAEALADGPPEPIHFDSRRGE